MLSRLPVVAVLCLGLGLPGLRAEEKVEASPEPEKVELPKPDADGWITLFDGKSLKGWYGDPKIWRVENGYISGKTDKQGYNSFLIYNHPFGNFVLEAKWILVEEKGNSGVQYRSFVVPPTEKDPKKWVVGGYQADIGKGWYGTNYGERFGGVIWKASDEVVKTVKAADWNQYVITADGYKVKQELNGKVTGEALDDGTFEKRPKKGPLEGIVALQYHAPGAFEIRFKDIRIKLLPPTEAK